MADEFWQDKELLSAEREADPPTAISDFSLRVSMLVVFRMDEVKGVLRRSPSGL